LKEIEYPEVQWRLPGFRERPRKKRIERG